MKQAQNIDLCMFDAIRWHSIPVNRHQYDIHVLHQYFLCETALTLISNYILRMIPLHWISFFYFSVAFWFFFLLHTHYVCYTISKLIYANREPKTATTTTIDVIIPLCRIYREKNELQNVGDFTPHCQMLLQVKQKKIVNVYIDILSNGRYIAFDPSTSQTKCQ